MLVAGLVGLGGAAALAAGASAAASPSVTSLPASGIVAAARQAIDGVSSVHVTGTGVEGGAQLTLDLYLAAGHGGRGTVSENGATFRLVVIGKTLYFNGSKAFWQKSAGASAAKQFAGKWLRAPTTGQFAAVANFTNVSQLFTTLLTPKGTLTKGAVSTVGGRRVIAVVDKGDGGTLYVAATGKPYPVEIVNNTTKHGTVVIDDINQPVKLAAPAHSIAIS